ncbi:hypothetical protein [Tomitella biformata]|uniref:hypothetical protein n=1 Tax=Tomitella biformata TaxID=630403 RepID=UPI000463FDF3|nr:hypothetical protein [Tomitella biformata]
MDDRFLHVPSEAARADLAVFLGHAVRVDPDALVRFKRRADGALAAWTTTSGFDTLAGRVFDAQIQPADFCVGAEHLLAALQAKTEGGRVDPGFPMDASWRGSLPPEHGFEHVDDVPARTLVELSAQGAELARENSTVTGPPRSLLDQIVLEVDGGGHQVEVPLRSLFALTAMGFIPGAAQDSATGQVDLAKVAADEPVRVRATRSWLRLDARYGSVCLRVGGEIPLLIS